MRVRGLFSLLVSAAVAAPLLTVAAAPAAAATEPPWQGALDAVTSSVRVGTAPYGPPVPITYVVVSGTISGCTPGRYFSAWTTLEQDGVVLSLASGGLGADDAVCGPDGTFRVSHGMYSPDIGGLPRPGTARATLHAEDPYGGGVLVDVTSTVTIPGPTGTIDRRTSRIRWAPTPVADPAKAPTVWVRGTLRGCTPGRYVQVYADLVQDGVALDLQTGRGGSEYLCPDSGVLRWRSELQKIGVSGTPHRGRALATLHYVEESATGRIEYVLATRWVTIPGCRHRHH